MRIRFARLLAVVKLGVLMLLSFPILAEEYGSSKYNMPRGVTVNSEIAYESHMVMFWACVIIGVIVFGVMFYAMIFHRKAAGAKSANFHESVGLEITWTIIPLLILVGMGAYATSGLITMYDTEKDVDMNVKVVGYQWKWRYEYPEAGVNFFSVLSTPREQIENKAPKGKNYLLEVDKPLVLPVDKKIRFIVYSNDVIHSWWVPALGVKRDAIPGYPNDAWAKVPTPKSWLKPISLEGAISGQPEAEKGTASIVDGKLNYIPPADFVGDDSISYTLNGNASSLAVKVVDESVTSPLGVSTDNDGNKVLYIAKRAPEVYRGVCAELCGKDHGFMPIVVEVKPQVEFDRWLKAEQVAAEKIRELNEKVFDFEELYALGEQVYSKNCVGCHGTNGEGGVGKAIAGSKIATGDLDKHIDIIVNGSANNNLMSAFGDQLSPADLAAVVVFQRNAFGNDDGKQKVQPSYVFEKFMKK